MDTLRASPALTALAPVRDQPKVETNNFDAVRLFAAFLVLGSHHLFLSGMTQPKPTGNTLGEVAVMIFFVISGYLISQSWYRDPHIVRFIMRRILRLWPALAAATVLIALVCLPITTLPWRLFASDALHHFVAR